MDEVENVKNVLMQIALTYDDDYYIEDNVIYAKNIFLINSVLSWYFDTQEEAAYNAGNLTSILGLLEKHLKKEVVLSWEGGALQVLTPKKKAKAGKK